MFVSDLGSQAVGLICRGGGRQFDFFVGGWDNTIAGFGLIDGKNANDNPTTTRADHWLVAGQRHVSLVKVRKDSVEGWFDGKRVTAYKTDWRDMSLPDYNRLRRTDCVGIDAYDGVRVESAKIIEIAGEGKYLRPPPAPTPPSPTPPIRVPDSFGTPEALECEARSCHVGAERWRRT